MNLFFIIILICSTIDSSAQSERKYLRDGNILYKEGKYNDSEINYRKSLEKNKDSFQGTFNLGDALYKQGKYEEAAMQFGKLTSKKTSKENLARAYHNLGNSLLKSQKLEESIEAYKNALKNIPGDAETKYNLSYAKAMLKQKQNQNNEQNKDKQNQDKEQNQGNNNQEKQDKQEQSDNKNQKNESSEENKSEKQSKKPQQNLSKEDAERILEALNNDEKDLQKKLNKKQAVKVKIEKNW